MDKTYWVNVFSKREGISLLVINRIINCVLLLYLDLMFTFRINVSLLIVFLIFRNHNVLDHTVTLFVVSKLLPFIFHTEHGAEYIIKRAVTSNLR